MHNGRHRAGGTRRSKGAGQAVDGIATLVVAASGAVALQPAGSRAIAAGEAVVAPLDSLRAGLSSMSSARADAAGRAARGERDGSAGPTGPRSGAAGVRPAGTPSDTPTSAASAAAAARQEAAEHQAWERRHAREVAQVERRAAKLDTVPHILDRNIRWVLPLASYRLSAGFGSYGTHWVSFHTGQDFAAPLGSPVRSVGDGEVVQAGYDGPYGYRLVVRLDDGTEVWYCHLSAFVVSSGPVRPGQLIARVGSTGNSTGPHLHFEVHPGGGDAVDPMPWLRAHGLTP